MHENSISKKGKWGKGERGNQTAFSFYPFHFSCFPIPLPSRTALSIPYHTATFQPACLLFPEELRGSGRFPLRCCNGRGKNGSNPAPRCKARSSREASATTV